MSPQIIFGTAMFGMDKTEFLDASSVTAVLQILKHNGIARLDSAARYPPLYPGRSEQLIGTCKDVSAGFLVDTKVYIDTKTDGSGDLTASAVEKSAIDSLTRLERKQSGVNVLHTHRADPATPVREQVLAFNDQIKKGHCKAWGVSNVPLDMLKEMLAICETEGLKKPVCYQGEYNIITRGAEDDLLPLLRKHGMAFNAFRPLASGFMTGNFIKGNDEGTRFSDDNPLGKHFQKLFGADNLRTAMEKFDAAVTAQGLSTIEAAVRWILYHSALQDQDGVIFGASRVSQVQELAAMIQKGPLPSELLQPASELWDSIEESRASIR